MTISVYEKEIARMEAEVLALKTQKEHPLGTIDFYKASASTTLSNFNFSSTYGDAYGTVVLSFEGNIPARFIIAYRLNSYHSQPRVVSNANFSGGGFNSAMTQYSLKLMITDIDGVTIKSTDTLYAEAVSVSPVKIAFSKDF